MGVSAMAYSPDGGHIAAAGVDGSLQIYRASGSFSRPELTCWDAHAPGTETSCIKYSMDGDTIITRGGDDTLKVWDVRKLKAPVKTFDNLVSYYDTSDCCFSPDQDMILTGTSAKKGGTGQLIFINRSTLQIEQALDVAP